VVRSLAQPHQAHDSGRIRTPDRATAASSTRNAPKSGRRSVEFRTMCSDELVQPASNPGGVSGCPPARRGHRNPTVQLAVAIVVEPVRPFEEKVWRRPHHRVGGMLEEHQHHASARPLRRRHRGDLCRARRLREPHRLAAVVARLNLQRAGIAGRSAHSTTSWRSAARSTAGFTASAYGSVPSGECQLER